MVCLFTEIILGRLSEEEAISIVALCVYYLHVCQITVSVVLGKREAEEREEMNTRVENVSGYM